MIVNQNKKTIIIILTIIATVALFLVLITTPLMKTIIADSEALALEKQKINNLSKEASGIKDSEAFYYTQLENINKINKIFINADAPIGFIASLEESANRSGLTIEISPSSLLLPSKAKKPLTTESLEFQLSVEGLAPNCLKFLNRLENSPYLISIRSVNIVRVDQPNTAKNSPEETNSSISGVKATIVISAFVNNNR